ncbi:phage tail spike protein [Virgibacillus halodenitrificans]|uniref:phage tail spike protein n=1 Tax=Virgibacillus halodenitrificans TaxID=1482 RepID=UPI000AAC7B24|nr:phage tail spike protein [Virgibacillus halodenitrificans]
MSNQIWSASFSLPINDPKVKKVELLKYVEITDKDEYIGLFRIIPKQTSSTNHSVTFQCEHVLATLLGSTLFKYHQLTNYSTREVLQYLLDQQKVKHIVLGTVAFTRYFHYSWENENLLSAIFSVPKPFNEQSRWYLDTTTYPWVLSLLEVETEPTCRLKEGYNLIGFEIEEDPRSVFNRIYPLGAGEGVNQLTIESVNNGVPYIEDIAPGEEIHETVWVDKRFEDAASLKASSEALLQKWKNPIITWKASAADVSSITGLEIDKLKEGRVLRIELDDYPTTELRIMKESKSDITGDPGNVQLEIGNLQEDLGTTQADLERRQQINELYSQGATNIMVVPAQDNADTQHPLVLPFVIDEDVVNVNTLELWLRTKPFRTYSETTKNAGQIVKSVVTGGGGSVVKSSTTGGGGAVVQSNTTSNGGSVVQSVTTQGGGSSSQTSNAGGDHRHVVFQRTSAGGPFDLNTYAAAGGSLLQLEASTSTISTAGSSGNHSHAYNTPSHTHGLSINIPGHTHPFSIQLPNHTHPFEFTLPNHTHPLEISIPGHIHGVEHKIIELDETPSNVQIKVDGNLVEFSGTSGDRINLIDYVNMSGGKVTRGRHEVEILPDSLARIEAEVIFRVFIKSQLGGTF